MNERRPHAIVVGGTGMLRAATLGIAGRGFAVSVVARSARRLSALVEEAASRGGVVWPVCVDYRFADAFAYGLEAAVRTAGPPSLAVVWAHAVAPDAPLAVAQAIDDAGAPADFYHVLGSAVADPSAPNDERVRAFREFPRIAYHEVILGFVRQARASRWLTEAEISAGVLQAVDTGALQTVVGVVEPWEARP